MSFALFFLLFACSKAQLHPADPTHSATSGVQLLESIENAFVGVAERSNPAVVGVTAWNVEGRVPFRRSDRQEGTGFIFRKDGYILTNNHVVSGANRITVRLFDGREFKETQLIGVDPNTDVAVLKIDVPEELPVLPFGDSDRVKVGQFTIAIGNPFQLNYTVTTGIVSGKGRSPLPLAFTMHYQDFIQTDAWINRGNSGGPLLNIHGEVIGINSAIRRADDAPTAEAVKAGAGFAIPINLVEKVSDQLIANGQVIRGWLGIFMTSHADGIRVTRFSDPSPARQGGMEVGDVIVEYNGQETQEVRKFRFLIAESMVGEEVMFTVIRDGVRKKLSVTIGKMPRRFTGLEREPESESWKKLGIAVRELGTHDSERYAYLSLEDEGVIVEEVRLGGLVPSAGVPLGTLIVGINDQRIKNMADYEKALQNALDKSEITFEIKNAYTEKGTETVTVKINQE